MTQPPSEQPRRSISYADAGVDIDAGDATARRFGAIGRGTHGPEGDQVTTEPPVDPSLA